MEIYEFILIPAFQSNITDFILASTFVILFLSNSEKPDSHCP